ncbi:ABC transporter substrate-binding protein [Kineococcus sp. SYSU DK004]|uniref:ABC transporter substrate-binding protein n=1 Tax=Kineococcus sp. SYSU DK004 TaxID=3383125 RepID=UPI003D7C9DDB
MPSTPSPARRSVSRRAFGGLAAGTAATAGLAACGGGSGSGDGPAQLRFTWWGSDARHGYTQQIIDAFNEEHPDIQVTGEFAEWSGYWDRLATTVAANDAPDIMQMDAIYLRSYADRGALLDLSTLGDLDTSGIDAEALNTGDTGEGLFGLVTGLNALTIITNPRLLEETGQALPDDSSWTWDDYVAAGAAVSGAGVPDVYGISTGGMDEITLQSWARQRGEALYSPDGEVVLPTDLLVDWWEHWLGALDAGAAVPVTLAVEEATASLDQNGMALGRTAMAPFWNTQLTALAKLSGDPLTLLRPPRQDPAGSTGLYYKPSMFWSASARTRHPEACAVFLDHLVNSTDVADLMLTERGVPANSAVREHITPQLDETDTQVVQYIDDVAGVVEETPPSAPAGASGIEEIVRRYGTDVLFRRQEPAAAAQALVDELTASVQSA